MKTLSIEEVVAECAKTYPNKPQAISARDIKTWTYDAKEVTVHRSDGSSDTYGARKLIPDSMKVERQKSYTEEVVPLLLRIRKLQAFNLTTAAISTILEDERKTQKKSALCRDCGHRLDFYFDNESDEAVCEECSENVAYNHSL